MKKFIGLIKCYLFDIHDCDYEMKWDRWINYYKYGVCKRCKSEIEIYKL